MVYLTFAAANTVYHVHYLELHTSDTQNFKPSVPNPILYKER
jgi:hypothetical protein